VYATGRAQRNAPASPVATRRVRMTTVGAAFVMAAAAMAVEVPVASAAECKDVEVVFARGTDEPPGIGVVGQALVDELQPLLKGKSIGSYAVNYPASWDFLAAAKGANDASARVQSTAAKCPNTKIVLGGYSQGAAVIDVVTTSAVAGLGFTKPMPAAVAKNVAAVAVFGNPSARLGQPLTVLSPLYGPKTADMCNVADPICSLGTDFKSHTSYQQSGLVKRAAQWVAGLVSPRKTT
jgi:cutinase